MFYNCSGLTSLDLSSFDTSKVTTMQHMFYNCSGLTTIYVSDQWSTAAVTARSGTFSSCYKLVGGMGTTFDYSYTDATYARIDGGPTSSTPGYLTDISVKPASVMNFNANGNSLDSVSIQ